MFHGFNFSAEVACTSMFEVWDVLPELSQAVCPMKVLPEESSDAFWLISLVACHCEPCDIMILEVLKWGFIDNGMLFLSQALMDIVAHLSQSSAITALISWEFGVCIHPDFSSLGVVLAALRIAAHSPASGEAKLSSVLKVTFQALSCQNQSVLIATTSPLFDTLLAWCAGSSHCVVLEKALKPSSIDVNFGSVGSNNAVRVGGLAQIFIHQLMGST
ncbi:hypothetical protein EDD22DRAFT_844778 [Suillus occidentalis]|nr:hypothetical protein EDD22DRAFT_844778 [Suillus occidentalis]